MSHAKLTSTLFKRAPVGNYVPDFLYSDERQLIGDLLRFGVDVEVLAPADRSRMKRTLHEAKVSTILRGTKGDHGNEPNT